MTKSCVEVHIPQHLLSMPFPELFGVLDSCLTQLAADII